MSAIHEATDEQRISRAFSAMPYGGLALKFPAHDAEWTLGMVADNLEQLQTILREVADDSGARDQELTEIRHEVAAVGSFMRRAMEGVLP